MSIGELCVGAGHRFQPSSDQVWHRQGAAQAGRSSMGLPTDARASLSSSKHPHTIDTPQGGAVSICRAVHAGCSRISAR